MTDKTAARRQKRRYQRMKDLGLTLVNEWVPEPMAPELRRVAKRMRSEYPPTDPSASEKVSDE